MDLNDERVAPLRDELWTIEAHDDQPVAEGKKYAADRRVAVLLNGERIQEFLYPSYRIWTLLAHWQEGIDGMRETLRLRAGGDES